MTDFVPYVHRDEYALYGISEAEANPVLVTAASRLVNSYTGRPEGMIWAPDFQGFPAYMANLNPTRSYTVPAGISPGSGVVVTIPGGKFGHPQVGDVVVIDRSDTCETCIISAAAGNTLTLETVQATHAAGATLEFGLVIGEELQLRAGNPTIRASRAPMANLLSGYGRYGFGKLPRQITDSGYACDALLMADTIGLSGPPAWSPMDIAGWDINHNTGAILVLPCSLQSGQLDVRIRYVAGWDYAHLPGDIKEATANIVRSAGGDRGSSNIKLLKAGDGTIEWFGPSALDADTMALLQPYRRVRI